MSTLGFERMTAAEWFKRYPVETYGEELDMVRYARFPELNR